MINGHKTISIALLILAHHSYSGRLYRRGREDMAQEFYIECPKCNHVYNVHKIVYDKGPEFLMYCPNCMHRYQRKDGKIRLADFQLRD
jgi:hypothetical protein